MSQAAALTQAKSAAEQSQARRRGGHAAEWDTPRSGENEARLLSSRSGAKAAKGAGQDTRAQRRWNSRWVPKNGDLDPRTDPNFFVCGRLVRGQIASMDPKPIAEILPTHTPALFGMAVARAAELLRAGELVALPTETVYGLAANGLDARAVAKIFEVKARPGHNPIIVHVASVAMARLCVAAWPEVADRLASAFWPGPLSLVLPRSHAIPDLVTAGGATVGVRWPRHPFIQAVMEACNFPLAVPSANLSTRVSPTKAQHVQKSLGNKIPLIIDGGPSQVGIESTVVDLVAKPPRVLRPGMIHAESLSAVAGAVQSAERGARTSAAQLPSPGLLPRHYAPRAKLMILSWLDDADLHRQLSIVSCRLSAVHVIAHTRIPSGQGLGRVSVMPLDAQAFARAIYAELHRCDEEGAELIAVESLPGGSQWHSLADRLARAAA